MRLTLLLLLAGLLGLPAPATGQVIHCPSTVADFATFPASDLTNGRLVLHSLKEIRSASRRVFVTTCPIHIIEPQVGQATCGSPTPAILKVGDRYLIDEDHNVTLLAADGRVIRLEGRRLAPGFRTFGIVVSIPYRVLDETTAGDGVADIYFMLDPDETSSDATRIRKRFYIEAFDRRTDDCDDHLPDAKNKRVEPRQTNVSTGGEPPRNP